MVSLWARWVTHRAATWRQRPRKPPNSPASPRRALSSRLLDGEAGGASGKEPPVQDLIITNADSYHLLKFVTTTFDSTVFLHLWLDRSDGNLALARIRLAEMADRLVLG